MENWVISEGRGWQRVRLSFLVYSRRPKFRRLITALISVRLNSGWNNISDTREIQWIGLAQFEEPDGVYSRKTFAIDQLRFAKEGHCLP